MRQSRGRASKFKTEARPCEVEARPSQLKNCLEAASSRGRCLEDSIPDITRPCGLRRRLQTFCFGFVVLITRPYYRTAILVINNNLIHVSYYVKMILLKN